MQTQLNSFFSRGDDRGDFTGSMMSSRFAPPPPTFTGTDLAIAQAAASVLLERNGEASGPWENPLTGARGTITPLATAYRDGNAQCRDFLASYVRERIEAWLQGEACRNGNGLWEWRDLRPWRRS